MLRLLIPLICLTSPAVAQTVMPRGIEAPCEVDGTEKSCVMNLACIGDAGRWFEGRAFGWNEGRVTGRTSDGVACNGTWAIGRDGAGRTRMTCEDGTTAELTSTYQDYATGTAIGEGITSTGQSIKSFSGEHVLEFLRIDGVPVLPCGDAGITLTEDGVPIS